MIQERRLLELGSWRSVDLVDQIYELQVQYLAGRTMVSPMLPAEQFIRDQILFKRIQQLQDELRSRKDLRPLRFLIGGDRSGHGITPKDNLEIRELLAQTRLGALLINIDRIRLVRAQNKPCFLLDRARDGQSDYSVAYKLSYDLPEGPIKLTELIQDALAAPPVLNLGVEEEDQIRCLLDPRWRQQKLAFASQGCRVVYVGNLLDFDT